MNRLSRSTALKIAAIISFLLGLSALVLGIPLLTRGAAALDQTIDTPPYFVMVVGVITAVVRMIGAYGTWNYQRWGIVLTLIANAVDAVLAVPGILFAPVRQLQFAAIITVVASLAIIVLCLWRDRRSVAL